VLHASQILWESSEGDDILMDGDSKFYMQKYDKRFVPFSTFHWCCRCTSVKTTAFFTQVLTSINTLPHQTAQKMCIGLVVFIP